ncbi:MAG: FkbM family methyltransferase [Verrucomicrobia bacterium]|nr:FkbM family methyltransferase [Verrucomicrobiota bacterium]
MQSFSQFGEDVLLWDYFQKKPTGFFVEVGANHPTKFSQTWLLEQNGWRGLLVEPLTAKCELLRQQRPGSRVCQVAAGAPEQRGRARFTVAAGDDMLSGLQAQPGVTTAATEEVEVRTLDDLLADAGHPPLDLVSIDVEGTELDVLRGFDLARHRPRLVLLEDHLQRLSTHRHMLRHGYRLVKRTGCNNWYVPASAEFSLSSPREQFRLWKEIWLDTPLRCIRFFFKRQFAAKTN